LGDGGDGPAGKWIHDLCRSVALLPLAVKEKGARLLHEIPASSDLLVRRFDRG
jgi:hypothetical protein